MSRKIDKQSAGTQLRSRSWREKSAPRYWWHRLPDTDYVPPVYSDLGAEEWSLLREWYDATDQNKIIGECGVPLIALLQGLVTGSAIRRIVQIGTCAGYSALLLGFMLRRMGARKGLFTIDNHPGVCEFAGEWLARAQLQDYVELAQLHSLDPAAPKRAKKYLGGDPDLVILDTAHEYAATLQELDAWFPVVAAGGFLVLHDVSQLADDFDGTHSGGVRRAFAEWRRRHPKVESISLNGDSRTMELNTAYKDACGVGLIHKPGR